MWCRSVEASANAQVGLEPDSFRGSMILLAKEEKHEAPPAPAHHEAPHPAAPRNEAPRQQVEQRAQQNQQRAQQQNEQRAEQMQQRRAEQQQEKQQQQQQKQQLQQERQQERQQGNNRPAMEQQPFEREQRPNNAGLGNLEQRPHEFGASGGPTVPERRTGAPGFGNPGGNPGFGNAGSHPGFGSHPGQFQRPMTPPPLRIHAVPLMQAAPAPFLHGNISQAQRAQAQMNYQNMQNHLSAVPAAQAPPNYAAVQSAQYSQYTNNYPANIGGQPYIINAGNTYVNPVQSYPGWWGGYNPGPGWGWGTGLVLGASIRAGLGWLGFGWPRYYGAPPAGFMYPPNYIPTPWVYNPAANQWLQPGQNAYAPGPPPPDYTMPITVQVVEPMQVTAQDPVTGETVPETVNQLVMYNAFYHPEVGRWGYMNRAGYFIWLNTTPSEGVPSLIPSGLPSPDQF